MPVVAVLSVEFCCCKEQVGGEPGQLSSVNHVVSENR